MCYLFIFFSSFYLLSIIFFFSVIFIIFFFLRVRVCMCVYACMRVIVYFFCFVICYVGVLSSFSPFPLRVYLSLLISRRVAEEIRLREPVFAIQLPFVPPFFWNDNNPIRSLIVPFFTLDFANSIYRVFPEWLMPFSFSKTLHPSMFHFNLTFTRNKDFSYLFSQRYSHAS